MKLPIDDLPEIELKINGKLNLYLFSDIAEDCAETISKNGYKREKDNETLITKKGEVIQDKNKSTQIRKFFNEILRLKQKLIGEKMDWEDIAPYVNMLIAKTAYSKGRGHVTKCFLNMIKTCIQQINNKEEYLIFSDFFESFVAFYKLYAKE